MITAPSQSEVDRDALWSMEVFAAVVDRGTLAAAAQALRVTPSAVSKQLAKLEARIGVRLIQRTTRRLEVTSAGTRYREHARGIRAALEAADADVQSEDTALRGQVRVTAPTLLGQELVARVAADFVRDYPRVEVELDFTDRFVDLIGESVDIAIRVAPALPPSGLHARRIGFIEWFFVASPGYLRRSAAPRRPQDLADHACLALAGAERGRWAMTFGGRSMTVAVQGPIASTSLAALHRCALAGAGIVQCPAYLVSRDLEKGRLVRLLPNASIKRRVVFAVRASGRFVPPRVDALTTRLQTELRRLLALGS
jgi:DNA-binding transcriptional LysR family regulator